MHNPGNSGFLCQSERIAGRLGVLIDGAIAG